MIILKKGYENRVFLKKHNRFFQSGFSGDWNNKLLITKIKKNEMSKLFLFL